MAWRDNAGAAGAGRPFDNVFSWGLGLAGGALVLFVIAPLAGLFLGSSSGQLVRTAMEREVVDSVLLTLGVSLAGTLVFAVLAVPFAWFLARREFRGKKLVTAVLDLPVVIPHSAVGIALLTLMSPDTLLGRAGEAAGIRWVGSPWGIMLAMAYVSVPFLINSARDGFAAVPVRLEKTALSLGASPWRVFRTISLPLAWRAVVSGLILMWARGLSEFGAVIIIAYYPMITPILIYERFTSFGLAYARPVSALFVGVCLLAFLCLRLLSSGYEKRERGL